MKRSLGYIAGVLLLGGGGFAAFAAFQEPLASNGTTIDGQDLGGLTKDDLVARLDAWWGKTKARMISPRSEALTLQPKPMSLPQLGIEPDWDATLASIQFDSYPAKLLGQAKSGRAVSIVWRAEGADLAELTKFVADHARRRAPARVWFDGGAFRRTYEVTRTGLDERKVGPAVLASIEQGQETFELPLDAEPPRVPKEAVDSIKDVVSQFTTKFSRGNLNRSSNIRLAASEFDGVVMLPGDVLSYNDTVGQRTVKRGYKLAGVYANGRHDTGIGGGICQVSTTLFNAAALANLKIVSRTNHSMPVAYVPVGRDATVDFGNIDLKFENSTDNPVSVASAVAGGSITFRILGTKTPNMSVSLATTNHASWGNGVKYVTDSSVAPGRTKVIERGSAGRSCITWRIIRDGNETRREKLVENNYRATPRIIARGPAVKPKPRAKPNPAGDPVPPAPEPTTSPPTDPPPFR
ncbi:MAG: VanW family protein [Armatimonadetes bacterium]|nr:VanW family protein [Armatimonadota bacterium]